MNITESYKKLVDTDKSSESPDIKRIHEAISTIDKLIKINLDIIPGIKAFSKLDISNNLSSFNILLSKKKKEYEEILEKVDFKF